MRGAAASGIVVVLLSVSVVLGENIWGVTCPSTEICALKGSSVNIRCTYRHPPMINGREIRVEKKLWFKGNEPVTEFDCSNNGCTVRLTDLKESDAAQYKFVFLTNQLDWTYPGSPGVTLSVTGLRVLVSTLRVYKSHNLAELRCHSSCPLPAHLRFVWYKNGRVIQRPTSSSYSGVIQPADTYSCSVERYGFSSPPVSAPRVQPASVSPSGEIVEGSSVTLTCSGDANPAANYIWFKSNAAQTTTTGSRPLSDTTQLVLTSIRSSDSGEYYCSADNRLGGKTFKYIVIDVKYAPKLPSVSVRPSGDIMKDSTVTLTCSTHANPAAKYTWYKEKQKLLSGGAQLVFRSIQSSESGEYYCTAVNKLGRRTSESISVDVKYAPQLPSVSVSPSGEIVEGSSVTLTCSSDANPAASYTWYKENQTLSQGPEGIYRFTSISSEDRGTYYCKSQNEHGQIMSSLSLDVQYAPKPPSVSVSPSSEVLEGSSVNLTCSSDANPAANYTWYKENKHSAEASGQIFTIAAFRPEHSGNYYCEAQNRRGRLTSTLYLTVAAGNPTVVYYYINIIRLTLAAVILISLLLLSLSPSCCWNQSRKRKTLRSTREAQEYVEEIQLQSCPAD